MSKIKLKKKTKSTNKRKPLFPYTPPSSKSGDVEFVEGSVRKSIVPNYRYAKEDPKIDTEKKERTVIKGGKRKTKTYEVPSKSPLKFKMRKKAPKNKLQTTHEKWYADEKYYKDQDKKFTDDYGEYARSLKKKKK